jgi:hypothetical protein
LPGKAAVLRLHLHGPFFRRDLGLDFLRDAPAAREDSGERGDEVCVGGRGREGGREGRGGREGKGGEGLCLGMERTTRFGPL